MELFRQLGQIDSLSFSREFLYVDLAIDRKRCLVFLGIIGRNWIGGSDSSFQNSSPIDLANECHEPSPHSLVLRFMAGWMICGSVAFAGKAARCRGDNSKRLKASRLLHRIGGEGFSTFACSLSSWFRTRPGRRPLNNNPFASNFTTMQPKKATQEAQREDPHCH